MAIAITPFEAMCGFRPVVEIQSHLRTYPELATIVGSTACEAFLSLTNDAERTLQQNRMRDLFSAYISCEESLVSGQLSVLVHRLRSSADATRHGSLDNLILRLHSDFPSDRGILGPLLLNYIELKPGDAFFMGPNIPHAYVSGDCVECMALSDNVVRVGLTPKFKDVDTLLGMLDYTCVLAVTQCSVCNC